MPTYVPDIYSKLKLQHKLNTPEPVQSPNSLEPDNKQVFDHIVEVAEESRNAKVITKNPGPYRGIVFKGKYDATEVKSQIPLFGLIFDKPVRKTRIFVPTFCNHLPRPRSFTDCDQTIASLYPEYIAANATDTTAPPPGSIFWCNYLDRQNFDDPVYYGAVQDGTITLDGTNVSRLGTPTFPGSPASSPSSLTLVTPPAAGELYTDVAKRKSDPASTNPAILKNAAITLPWSEPVEKFECDPLEIIGINSGHGPRSFGGHVGVDFTTKKAKEGGSKVYAVETGMVTYYPTTTCGYMLMLMPDNKKKNISFIRYCHLGVAIDPSTGKQPNFGKPFKVSAGDWIGIASNSGVPTLAGKQGGLNGEGTHLHIEASHIGKKWIPIERLVPSIEGLKHPGRIEAVTKAKLKINQNSDKYSEALAIAQKRERERDVEIYEILSKNGSGLILDPNKQNPHSPNFDAEYDKQVKNKHAEQKAKARAEAENNRKKGKAPSKPPEEPDSQDSEELSSNP